MKGKGEERREKEGRGKGRRIFVEGEFRLGQKEVRTKKC